MKKLILLVILCCGGCRHIDAESHPSRHRINMEKLEEMDKKLDEILEKLDK